MLSLTVVALAFGVSLLQAQAWRTDTTRHTVPLEEIVSGGPPKDGIPALDHPRFTSVSEADTWLSDRDPVVLVAESDQAKAYPLQILIWHEIVNDLVDSRPVAVTFCPLCNTALAFDRRLDGRILDFGTTGRLRHSDLVMYDRQTESWWQQATGEGIVGEYAGRQLEFISAPVVSWEDFKLAHPGGHVLSRRTGYDRPYGQNPYTRYDEAGGSPIGSFFRARRDARLPAMARVVAVSLGGRDVAYPFAVLTQRPALNDMIGEVPVAVFWKQGTASALDTPQISQGKDVGSTGVFDRRHAGRVLSFDPAGEGRFRERETGSEFDILGRAITGPLRGTRLRPVPHGNHFWFAWAVFKPSTRVVSKPPDS